MQTNFTIQGTAPNLTVRTETTQCELGCVVIASDNSLRVMVETLEADGETTWSGERRSIGADLRLMCAVGDDVQSVRIRYEDSGGSWQTVPGADALRIAQTYRALTIDPDGRANRNFAYTSTSHTLNVINQTGDTMSWSWSVEGQPGPSGSLTDDPAAQPVVVPPGNGTLVITNDDQTNLVEISIEVYDMTSSTVTVTGADAWNAQPETTTPDTDGNVFVLNRTPDEASISVWWKGGGDAPTDVPYNNSPTDDGSAFNTDDADDDLQWYLKWDDTHDPKIIVKRPPVLTTPRR